MNQRLIKIKDAITAQKEAWRYTGFAKQASELFDRMNEKGVAIIILSSDCTGGRLMNDYRMPVNTPTVNNFYSADDFLKICENPEKYFSLPVELEGIDNDGNFLGKIDDVVVHLGHEESPEKAVRRWNRGCKQFFRAIKSPHEICVIMNDRNGFKDSDMARFEALPYTYKVIFTHKPYKNAPHSFYMKGEDHLPCVNIITRFESVFSLKRRYDRFDFFHQWFMNILR